MVAGQVARTMDITVGAPAQPEPFTAFTTPVCQGSSGVIYTVPNDPNVTYTWNYTGNGATINFGTSNSITVDFSVAATSGTLSVTASNSCSTSAPRTFDITVSPNNTVGPPSSTLPLCTGTPITPITLATTGATGIGAATGLPLGLSAAWAANTITISGTPTVMNTYNYSIPLTGGCGSVNATGTIIVTQVPGRPGSITGNSLVCQNSSQTYTTTAGARATSYTWTVPGDWTITAGQGTLSITVTVGGPPFGEIRVVSNNDCGTNTNYQTLTVTVNPVPAQPGAITGSTTVCQASSQTYSVSAVTGATSYTWTLPSGWTGTSTTNSITATAGSSGTISVTANNACGAGTARTLDIIVNTIPTTPGQITGTAAQCAALTGQTYTIGSVAGATTYTWTVPAGWTITAGAGTTSITVTAGAAGQNGNITVTAGNTCGTSAAQTLAVTVIATPATPGPITGTAAQCAAAAGQTYSITPVTYATTYTWTVPTGWTITAGAGTASITVTAGAAAQNGNITVTAGNTCGTSAAQTLAVTVIATPATPGPITGTTAQCAAAAGQTYSITPVTYATTYTWTVPTGWTITAGAGTASITVTAGAAGQNGNITVTAGNTCGTSAAQSLAVTVLATPATPGAITGTAAQCAAAAGQTYSITPVTYATTYTWTVPTGWTITAGAGTASITVTAGAAGQNGNITVTAGNTCGTSAAQSLAVTVLATPATPGAITGTAAQCAAAAGQTYSITPVTYATTYTWTVPTGWTITAGAGTASITVTAGAAGQNGNITVTAGNTCGTSAAQTLAVTVIATPATPGPITGTAAQCAAAAGQTYSITPVTYATTYTWTVPTGWTITAGAGTASITVTAGAAAQNGNITVTAGNTCGTSAAQTLAVTVIATPATPGPITGTTAQCAAAAGQTYSITPVTYATTYTWTVPAGWTITAGAGTASITVTAGAAGQNGNITVTAGNTCGTSAAQSLAVTVLATPATPGAITGTAAQCAAAAGQTYSITPVTYATTYTWTVPTGWTITAGAGTASITVTAGAAGQNGNITVTAGNTCGTSAAQSLAVTVIATPATPGPITGTAAQCAAAAGQTYSITPVTYATTYTWTVPAGWTITAGAGTTSITVTAGAAGQNGNITVTAGNTCGTSAAQTLAVTVIATPATPGAITGTAAQCAAAAGQTYSITPVTYATTYTWTVPTGWTITAGAGTTSITVTAGAAGQNGNITVTAGNTCGTSAAQTLAVTVVATPATPGAITGTAAQCAAAAGQTYSITPVTYATTYTWTVPDRMDYNSRCRYNINYCHCRCGRSKR